MSEAHIIELKPQDALITAATVYPFRAEITRRVAVDVPVALSESKGLVKIKLVALTNSLVEDSVRVEGAPEIGDVISFMLKDVATGAEAIVVKESSNEEVEKLLLQLRDLCGDYATLATKLQAQQLKKQLFETTISTAIGNSDVQPFSENVQLTNNLIQGEFSNTITHLDKALDFKTAKNKEIVASVQEIKCGIEMNKEKVSVVKNKIQTLANVACGNQSVYDPFRLYQELLEKCHMPDRQTKRNYLKFIEITLRLQGGGAGNASDVATDKKSKVRLVVSYLVNDASWIPKYDLRLRGMSRDTKENEKVASEGSTPKMQVTYMGSVFQRTGEDWSCVKLTLSSSSPTTSGAPPPLPPINVGFRQAGQPIPRGGLWGDICKMAAHANFVIPGELDVPSDGTKRQVTIGILAMPLSLQCLAKPEVSDKVYLLANVKNATDLLLMQSTDTSVYFDGMFITKTEMSHVSPGGEFSVFVGIDPQIVIKKHPLRTYRKPQGVAMLANKKFVDCYEQKLEVQNGRNIATNIALIMRLPRSEDATIVVSHSEPAADKFTPIEYPVDEDIFADHEFFTTGTNTAKPRWFYNKGTQNVMYTESVAGNTATKVTYSYTVEFPQDKELLGL